MSQTDFISSCYDILRDWRTGVLEVRAEGISTFLYFRSGELVFAEAGSLGDTLGRVLLQQGSLTREQHGQILRQMSEGLAHNEQVRFGEIAIHLGFLTFEQVNTALRDQVRRKFVHCLQWHAPTCQFVEDEEALAGLPSYPTPFVPLILEGVREHFDDLRYALALEPAENLYLTLREDAHVVATRFQLDGRGLKFLLAMDGTRQVRTLLEKSAVGAEASTLLVSLMISNSVRLTAKPVERRPATLQVSHDSVSENSVVVFMLEEPAAPLHPPAPAPVVAPAPPLPTRPPPAPADVMVARLEAERAYQAGCAHLSDEQWTAAADELRRAGTLYPDAVEYALAAAWAELRAGRGEGTLKDRRAQLRELAAQNIARDAGMALAHLVLGHILGIEGNDHEARRSLQTAARLQPHNLEVVRQLRVLDRRASTVAGPAAAGKRKSGTPTQGPALTRLLDQAAVARSSGKAAEAVRLLRDGLAKSPEHPVLSAELALTLLMEDPKRHGREANTLAKDARKADPQLAIPWVVVGMLLEQLGETGRASRAYLHALDLDPQCDEAQQAADRLAQ
jgi:tetratricopeptide (TPR) repeat protein